MRVWIAHPDGSLEETITTGDPVEAEAAYLRLCSRRLPGACALVIDPQRNPLVLPARYRLDAEWPAFAPREQVAERWRQLWAPAAQWDGPTPEQLRGLVHASGVSGAELARRIGVETRTWRHWLSDPESRQPTRIGYAAWVAVLRLSGLCPADEMQAPPTAP